MIPEFVTEFPSAFKSTPTVKTESSEPISWPALMSVVGPFVRIAPLPNREPVSDTVMAPAPSSRTLGAPIRMSPSIVSEFPPAPTIVAVTSDVWVMLPSWVSRRASPTARLKLLLVVRRSETTIVAIGPSLFARRLPM